MRAQLHRLLFRFRLCELWMSGETVLQEPFRCVSQVGPCEPHRNLIDIFDLVIKSFFNLAQSEQLLC